MTFTSQSPLVNIPLQGLPIAAAALDASGVIIAPNHRFVRLCGGTGSTAVRQHLAEVVSQRYRAAVEEGLHTLTALDHQSTQSCRIKALRAKSPSLWLAIDVVPLGPGAVVPYVACAQAIAARRRLTTRRDHTRSRVCERGAPRPRRWQRRIRGRRS